MTISNPFWLNSPTILFKKESIMEIVPTNQMTLEEKMNAVSRFVIVFTLLGYMFTKSPKIVYLGITTLAIIVVYYNYKKGEGIEGFSENLDNISKINPRTFDMLEQQTILNPETLETYLKSDFIESNKKNPMGNVLLTDIGDNPNRKAAPPSFNTEIYEDINNSTKKMIQSLNPGIKNTNKQLFGDLGEQFEFDQSMIQYYSTPNTKVVNDQGAFADFLYGDMPSCKDGDTIQCVKDNFRYNLY
jgi:hypothetical protein